MARKTYVRPRGEASYNAGDIIQPALSRAQGATLRKACRHFKLSYPATLARPKMALQVLFDYNREQAQ